MYRARCAACHGEKGEGVLEEYPRPLTGTRTVDQLASLIAKTMPADDPGSCSTEDASLIARFIHGEFYSPSARLRQAPPRVELARLTVNQYRNALADLMATFVDPGDAGAELGLRAEYYKARRFRRGDRVIERIDPQIQFHFGKTSPDSSKIEPHEFSARWEGSVLAPETGEYDFIVRTDHAARLWVNSLRAPLIDAWVKSGTDTEYRASVYLLGGRAYPIKLEFSKAKQGVDDSEKEKEPPPVLPAFIELAWKPPHQAEIVIPERQLRRNSTRELYVVTTPFPADDRSAGYERGTSVSKEWEQATTEGSLETAEYVAKNLNRLAEGSAGNREKLLAFCARFAERAFRRPLAEAERALYLDKQFAEAPSPDAALRRSLILILKSPRFLLQETGDANRDSWTTAADLALAAWDSLPDSALIEAAAAGRLSSRDEVEHHAQRMLENPRAHAKIRSFFLKWLRLDPPPELAKNPEEFPGFDASVATDLRSSLEILLDRVMWSERSDFRDLFLAQRVPLNAKLAAWYGASLPDESGFELVRIGEEERAGVLTHPYVLANFAYARASSPIHRGVFLARGVLGRTLRPPPEAAAPLAPDLHPSLTTRERVTLQTSPVACTTCHGLINPLGFALEKYDAIGRLRATEKDRAIDDRGDYLSLDGSKVEFTGARDLGRYLAQSEEVQDAFIRQLFHHLVQQPVTAFGTDRLARLRARFAEKEFNMKKLVVDILATAAWDRVPRGELAQKANGPPRDPIQQ
jgi:hypothetical protein